LTGANPIDSRNPVMQSYKHNGPLASSHRKTECHHRLTLAVAKPTLAPL
jgi:hypothetical protein